MYYRLIRRLRINTLNQLFDRSVLVKFLIQERHSLRYSTQP